MLINVQTHGNTPTYIKLKILLSLAWMTVIIHQRNSPFLPCNSDGLLPYYHPRCNLYLIDLSTFKGLLTHAIVMKMSPLSLRHCLSKFISEFMVYGTGRILQLLRE